MAETTDARLVYWTMALRLKSGAITICAGTAVLSEDDGPELIEEAVRLLHGDEAAKTLRVIEMPRELDGYEIVLRRIESEADHAQRDA